MQVKPQETKIIRCFALPLPTFNWLKEFQREYLEIGGITINNNQAIALILAEHKKFYEGGQC